MAITINGGTGVITGISVGGLPDGCVANDDLAGSIVDGKITGLSASKLSGSLPSISGASLTNLPSPAIRYVDATLNANMTLSDGVAAKVTDWEELLDSASEFASGTYTPQTAGKYFVYGQATLTSNVSSSAWHVGQCWIKKNSGYIADNQKNDYNQYHGQALTLGTAVIVDMNGSSDTLELWVHINTTTGTPQCMDSDTGETRFSAFYLGA